MSQKHSSIKTCKSCGLERVIVKDGLCRACLYIRDGNPDKRKKVKQDVR